MKWTEKLNQNKRIWPCGFRDHSMTRYWIATAMRIDVRASRAMMRRENCSSVRLRRGCWLSAALGPALLDELGDSVRRGSKVTVELYGPMISGASWHWRIAHTRNRYSEDELREERRNSVSEPLYIYRTGGENGRCMRTKHKSYLINSIHKKVKQRCRSFVFQYKYYVE